MSELVDESKKAFARYRDLLKSKGAKAKDCTNDGDTTSFDHLLWMCEFCLKNVSDAGGMSVDKFSRWMGYIQGVMVCKGLTTVEAERNTTRPWMRSE